jgi:tetratricopeptide (TPR) repeat protein
MNEPHDPNRHDVGSSVPADSHNPGQGKPVEPHSDAIPPPNQTGDRYQLFGEIARGSMGAVLRGRDVDLGRDIAVKVLLDKHANHEEVVRRFLEEAQIGGQLQHPGIPAVYDIGRFGERPFFTMKLVKGYNLEALLGERSDPSEDRPRLLAIVLQVAQTMAYAHVKGVIHRDLEPGNIMVGAFGEVQVMDWGLARVLDEVSQERPSPQDGNTIRTARGSPGSAGTPAEAGPLLGTPAYMPPEQARGEIARLDRRADVFALGAILCEVLTGKPPHVGPSAEEVLRKAASGDLGEALTRLDGCGADQELIVLTKACLSPEAIDRPQDAQAVAEALTIYLDGAHHRLRQAEVARAVAEATRRLLKLTLAVALVALLLVGGAFAWWRNVQAQAGRERDARNAEAVAALLGQAEEALKAGDVPKAAVALEAAKKRSVEGGAEQEAQRLGRLETDLALLRDLDAVDQFRWTVVDNKLPDPAAVARRSREALARFGVDPEAVREDEAVARVSASPVRERIVSALDRLLRDQKTAGVRALLRRVDADPYRDAVRDVVLANDAAKMAELAGQPTALEQPAGFVAFIGESPVIAVARRRQLLQAAVSRRPGDLGLLMSLAGCYPIDQKESAGEKVRWLQAAVTAAPANPVTHNNLGNALKQKGQVDEAIASFRNAIRLDPRFASAHLNLGNALHQKGDLDGAIACFRKALHLQSDLTAGKKALDAALKDKGGQGSKP